MISASAVPFDTRTSLSAMTCAPARNVNDTEPRAQGVDARAAQRSSWTFQLAPNGPPPFHARMPAPGAITPFGGVSFGSTSYFSQSKTTIFTSGRSPGGEEASAFGFASASTFGFASA